MGEAMTCQDLSTLMKSDGLFAVFDVRERGEYNQCQIPGTTSLPRSQIEFRIAELVPANDIQIVVYDDDGRRAQRAAQRLIELGYGNVAQLEGGLPAWQSQNYETVSGVNVPSKAFGEKVHHDRQVPDLTPDELKALQDRGEEMVIFDVRTPEEYGRFCIPGGQSVPGGDLILWAEELRGMPTVIVNCAGRTRSIIAAAALRRLGLTNVRALRNGTMGWVLAGFNLEVKPGRTGPLAPPASRERALAIAHKIVAEEKLELIAANELCAQLTSNPVAYVIDVRGEAEFAAAHLAGSLNVPGGQAVQRADDFAPVRNAPIVFISNDSARAIMAAYWYRQMGFPKVAVLAGGLNQWRASGYPLASGAAQSTPLGIDSVRSTVKFVEPAEFCRRREKNLPLLLDVSSSLEFETAHLPGAKWITRGWIDIKLPELFPDRGQEMILTCTDGMQSVLAARTLASRGYKNVSVLAGGTHGWSAAGFAIAKGLESTLCEPNDVVLSPSIRGTKEDMENYLNWELKLKH